MRTEMPYFAAEYTNGSWAALYFAESEEKVHTWIIMAMTQYLNSSASVADGINPVLEDWINAIERRKTLEALRLSRQIDSLLGHKFAFVAGHYEQPRKSDGTRWTFNLGDIWDEQDRQHFRPLVDKTPVIDRTIKNLIRKEAK